MSAFRHTVWPVTVFVVIASITPLRAAEPAAEARRYWFEDAEAAKKPRVAKYLALLGEWTLVSYDCDGRTALPMDCTGTPWRLVFKPLHTHRGVTVSGRFPTVNDGANIQWKAAPFGTTGVEFEFWPGTRAVTFGQYYFEYTIDRDKMKLRALDETGERLQKKGAVSGQVNAPVAFNLVRALGTRPSEVIGAARAVCPTNNSATAASAPATTGPPNVAFKPDEKSDELKRLLSGRWVGVSYAENGKPFRKLEAPYCAQLDLRPAEYTIKLHTVFEKSRTIERFSLEPSGSWIVDARSEPMVFYRCAAAYDYLPIETHPPQPLAIFQLKDDELLWCMVDEEDSEPPYVLATEAGDLRTIIRFKRVSGQAPAGESPKRL